jgi:hypothetical protein
MARAMSLPSAAMNTILAIGFGGGIGWIARSHTMIGYGRLRGTSIRWRTLVVDVLVPSPIAIGGGPAVTRVPT